MKKRYFATILAVALGCCMGVPAAADTTDKALPDLPVYQKETDQATWNLVSFGSYPQREVTDAKTIEALDELADSEYTRYGDVVLEGETYRRLSPKGALNVDSAEGYYNWEKGGGKTGYHYFKYEPIIWRVLYTDNKGMLLLADTCLENKKFHNKYLEVNWKESSLRSWLNGYSGGANNDYAKGNSFLQFAFTEEERKELLPYTAENKGNSVYGTLGCENTTDKVFLLSEEEVAKEAWGFSKEISPSGTRIMECSDYAWARGLLADTSKGSRSVWWWLRTPGRELDEAAGVLSDGYMLYNASEVVDSVENGVCPVIYLSKTGNWKKAGSRQSILDKKYTAPPLEKNPQEEKPVVTPPPEPENPEPKDDIIVEPTPVEEDTWKEIQPQNVRVMYKNKNHALVLWKKTEGAECYRIRIIMKEKRKQKVKKIITEKNKYRFVCMKEGKKCLVQVCAGKKQGDSIQWSQYSEKIRYCHKKE